jgi:hypothetical protein
MLSRSERYLAKAEKCQQISDAANTSGTKRLYGVLASQWRQLAEEADEIDKKPLLEKIRHAHTPFGRSTRLKAQSESLERFLKVSQCQRRIGS